MKYVDLGYKNLSFRKYGVFDGMFVRELFEEEYLSPNLIDPQSYLAKKLFEEDVEKKNKLILVNSDNLEPRGVVTYNYCNDGISIGMCLGYDRECMCDVFNNLSQFIIYHKPVVKKRLLQNDYYFDTMVIDNQYWVYDSDLDFVYLEKEIS